MTLGQTITRLRTVKGLSQGALAEELGVSRQSVSKWETDASVPELEKLLRALHAPRGSAAPGGNRGEKTGEAKDGGLRISGPDPVLPAFRKYLAAGAAGTALPDGGHYLPADRLASRPLQPVGGRFLY